MNDHLYAWYVGVDEEYWKPMSNDHQTSNKVMVYWKTEPEHFCHSVEELLRKYGWEPVRIHYGHYDLTTYKKVPSEVRFAVSLSRFESQGIALAEAWSMDVPTLPWNPKENYYNNKTYHVPSCPYLCALMGKDWKELADLKASCSI